MGQARVLDARLHPLVLLYWTCTSLLWLDSVPAPLENRLIQCVQCQADCHCHGSRLAPAVAGLRCWAAVAGGPVGLKKKNPVAATWIDPVVDGLGGPLHPPPCRHWRRRWRRGPPAAARGGHDAASVCAAVGAPECLVPACKVSLSKYPQFAPCRRPGTRCPRGCRSGSSCASPQASGKASLAPVTCASAINNTRRAGHHLPARLASA